MSRAKDWLVAASVLAGIFVPPGVSPVMAEIFSAMRLARKFTTFGFHSG